MKRRVFVLALVGVAAAFGGLGAAEALKSGPQVGDPAAPFDVTKIAGPKDGAAIGDTLCYR